VAFAVVVGEANDLLAQALSASLTQRGLQAQFIDAADLALQPIQLRNTEARLNGRGIDVAVFLAEANRSFGGDFTVEDRDFCDAEVRAIWLALLNLPSVKTLTRWTAEEWASMGGWAIWRRRLSGAGIPLTSMSFGSAPDAAAARWFPFTSTRTHTLPGGLGRRVLVPPLTGQEPVSSAIWCCGQVIAGPDLDVVRACGSVLENYGTRLASITLDEEGRVFACASRLHISDMTLAIRVADRAAEQLCADLSGR
jgi:hypothetical protein